MAKPVEVYGFDIDRSIYPGPLTLHALGELVTAGAFLHDEEAMAHIAALVAIKNKTDAAGTDMMPYLRQVDKTYPLVIGAVRPDVRHRALASTAAYVEATMLPLIKDIVTDRKRRGEVVFLSNGPDIFAEAVGRLMRVHALGRKPEEYAFRHSHPELDKWRRLARFCATNLGLYLEDDPQTGAKQNAKLKEFLGDSPGDLSLLERAEIPRVINPCFGLEDIAPEKGWTVHTIDGMPLRGDLSPTMQYIPPEHTNES